MCLNQRFSLRSQRRMLTPDRVQRFTEIRVRASPTKKKKTYFAKISFSLATVSPSLPTFDNHNPEQMTLKTDASGNIATSPVNDPTPRRLYIDFDLYTDGDKEYKKELCTLIIDNIREFQQSLLDAVREKNPEVFLKSIHKVKVTLGMLDDQEFYNLVRELETSIVDHHGESHFATRSSEFQNICNVIIINLKTEINA